MSIQGIRIGVKFQPPVLFTDEWIDAIYTSLEKNMALVSVDLFMDEDNGGIDFLLGVDNFLDGDDFCEGVARDAIEKAFEDAAGPNNAPDSAVSAERVGEFV